ncbi:50S ribosomal protein L11 [bacterium]|nr:50S ribosomal protein L11 [bacterium]
MAKKIKSQFKVIITAGKAVPAPPLGPALSAKQVNIKEFCDKFNEATRQMGDIKVPAIVTTYDDRTFSIELRTPPVSDLIKKKIKISAGSAKPNLQQVGTLTKAQVREIAEEKMKDLNTTKVESAMNTVAGTARQMGVKIVD